MEPSNEEILTVHLPKVIESSWSLKRDLICGIDELPLDKQNQMADCYKSATFKFLDLTFRLFDETRWSDFLEILYDELKAKKLVKKPSF